MERGKNVMGKKRASQAIPKKKKIAHELISPDSKEGAKMYALLKSLVGQYHSDLGQARIALAFNRSWRPDVDGRVQLGKMRLASDLDLELAEFDFVVILSFGFWKDPEVSNKQREALLDHELSHGALQRSKNLEPIEDEKGRKCYRVCKHDIEEFSAVAGRHGVYKKDLEAFARALMRARQRDLFTEAEEDAGPREVAPAGPVRVTPPSVN